MAFNFNWSPLTADASFYTRAQELLTTALNKSPKPPIIVDDILVNELNLGSVPPDLEILEIGDLAEDRFRGIFKMCYSGDAFLTLKTRVQANPLNTYLSTRPSFTSPQPLAAASGLTIPLQITLSEIKLSAFIILVFSRQKGLTLVFRNDPLESLKVSSTFDSIPFVREYLQMEIEGQLRTLLMDEVPAIIHRLSLRLWVPEYEDREDQGSAKSIRNPLKEDKAADPLASPPQDPVDLTGHLLDAAQIVSLSLDSSSKTHSLFSQKNLLRLGVLTNSQKTLSLFTPTIRNAIFRAWAGPTERGELLGSNPAVTPLLSRAHSYVGSISTSYTFPHKSEGGHPLRPALTISGSQAPMIGNGANRKVLGGRKRKHRVVNLRKKKADMDDLSSLSCEGSTISSAPISAPSEFRVQTDGGDELMTPPRSPEKAWQRNDLNSNDFNYRKMAQGEASDATPKISTWASSRNADEASYSPKLAAKVQHIVKPGHVIQIQQQQQPHVEKSSQEVPSSPKLPLMTYLPPFPYTEPNSVQTGILEQAWVIKIAREIARQVHDQKAANNAFWDRNDEGSPPPAYGS